MRLNTAYIALIFAGVLAGGIALANGSGLWVTESTKEPMAIKEGAFTGMADPADIRGSYSFGDIASSFDITPEIIAEAFGIETGDPATVLCKDLEEIYPNMDEDMEIGTGAIKQFVAIYTGLPYEGEDGFPSTAIAVLEREGKWTQALADSLEGSIVDMEGMTASDPVQPSEETAEEKTVEEHGDDEIAVKGKTTVSDVIGWGLTKEQVEEVIGTEIENVNMTIRDICEQNGAAFSEVKEALNAMLD